MSAPVTRKACATLVRVWPKRSRLLRGNQLHSGVLSASLACHDTSVRLSLRLTPASLSRTVLVAGSVDFMSGLPLMTVVTAAGAFKLDQPASAEHVCPLLAWLGV